jgi:hypothetical protein
MRDFYSKCGKLAWQVLKSRLHHEICKIYYYFQGRRNIFEIGGAEFLEAPPWLAQSGKFFEN